MKKSGDEVPYVVFKTRVRNDSDSENPFEWKDVDTHDLFKGKRVVLFSLPGAFTPTCSTKHLPSYDENYNKLRSLGVDEVYCLSVNDAFVMRQWGLHLGLEEDKTPYSNGFKNVKLVPDGTCEFTSKMGMECDWTTERGFGLRSWRYSMVVNDCVIEKMFVEEPMVQNSKDDPYVVSDCDTMLKYLNEK